MSSALDGAICWIYRSISGGEIVAGSLVGLSQATNRDNSFRVSTRLCWVVVFLEEILFFPGPLPDRVFRYLSKMSASVCVMDVLDIRKVESTASIVV